MMHHLPVYVKTIISVIVYVKKDGLLVIYTFVTKFMFTALVVYNLYLIHNVKIFLILHDILKNT